MSTHPISFAIVRRRGPEDSLEGLRERTDVVIADCRADRVYLKRIFRKELAGGIEAERLNVSVRRRVEVTLERRAEAVIPDSAGLFNRDDGETSFE